MEKSRINFGVWETTMILVNTFIVPVFLNLPRMMIETGGSGGWIVSLYVSVIALAWFAVIAVMYRQFQGMDLLDIGEYIGGGFLRIVVGLIIVVDYALIVSIILREYAEDMKVIALTNSPISFVEMFFAIGMLFGAFMGIEAIVRFGAIIIPIILIGFAVILLGVSPYYSIENLAPLFGNGASAILGRGALRVSAFSGLSILFMLMPYIKTHGNFKKAGYLGLGIGGFNFIISTVVYEMAFSYPAALENFLPVYNLARIINFGRFFQRIESIFVLIWAASALLYLSVTLNILVYAFKKAFGLPYYRPLLLPFCVLIFAFSLLPPSLMDTINLEVNLFRNTAWIVTFAMSVILLAIAGFVKKVRKKEAVK